MVGSSYLRIAAGVCVLSTGLLWGASGAIAVGDTYTTASASTNGGTGGPSQVSSPALSPADGTTSSLADGATSIPADSSTSSPVGIVTHTLRKTLQRITVRFGSGRTPGQQSTDAASPMSGPGGADITEENNDSDLVAAVPAPVAPDSTVVAPATISEPVPGRVAALSTMVEPVPAAVAQTPNIVDPVSNMAARVSTVVPVLFATSSDVIAAVENMLTSAAGAVRAFTQQQADLFSLLGIARVGPVAAGAGGHHHGVGQSVVADASVPFAPPMVLQSPIVPPQTGIPGVTWDSNATAVAPIGGIATTRLGHELPLTEQERPARDVIVPMGVGEFVQQAFDELRRSPALAALVAAALPGLGGLLVVTGAGMRLGYRQAKAELALRTAGVTRFARSGPIGVVRSGSMVYVRPRTLHVVRPGTVGAGSILDEAA
jgi:hypothetical protein